MRVDPLGSFMSWIVTLPFFETATHSPARQKLDRFGLDVSMPLIVRPLTTFRKLFHPRPCRVLCCIRGRLGGLARLPPLSRRRSWRIWLPGLVLALLSSLVLVRLWLVSMLGSVLGLGMLVTVSQMGCSCLTAGCLMMVCVMVC